MSGVTITYNFAKTGRVTIPNGGVLSIGSAGSLTNNGSNPTAEVYGTNAVAGSLRNQGTIRHTTGAAVYLTNGSYITNSASALIIGGTYGVLAKSIASTIVTAGQISATSNAGIGINLLAGGVVTNATGGLIEASASAGIALSMNAEGTVSNSGTLSGYASGVVLGNGGVVNNLTGGIIVATAATVATTADGIGVFIANAAGTVSNAGTITAAAALGYGVRLQMGGSLTNLATGRIAASALGGIGIGVDADTTIENQGTVTGDYVGICLANGGLITNLAGGTIVGSGYAGVGAQMCAAPGILSNAGMITATSTLGTGVRLMMGGSVTRACRQFSPSLPGR